MAYFLFKYLRRKYKERKAATTDEGHLIPEVEPGREGKPETLNSPDEHHAVYNAEENARIKAEAAKRRKYRWKMILGLILPNFLAAVDVTIVAPAVPQISSHFSMCRFITQQFSY